MHRRHLRLDRVIKAASVNNMIHQLEQYATSIFTVKKKSLIPNSFLRIAVIIGPVIVCLLPLPVALIHQRKYSVVEG